MSKEKRFVAQVDPLGIEDVAIFDNKELRLYECQSDMIDICNLLNQQNQRIAELEEQLKNVIMLNLKVGQEVYVIENEDIFKDILEKIEITENGILFYVEEGIYGLDENEIFATLEEAQERLKNYEEL